MARGKEQYQVRKEARTVTIVVVSHCTTTIMAISPKHKRIGKWLISFIIVSFIHFVRACFL